MTVNIGGVLVTWYATRIGGLEHLTARPLSFPLCEGLLFPFLAQGGVDSVIIVVVELSEYKDRKRMK